MRVFFLLASGLLLGACDQMLISAGEEAAANLLRDPSSAQFRNVRSDGDRYVCGQINGKNGFGAYAGFNDFYAFETVDGDWMATIYNERELQQLPPELAQITRDNFRTAMARCDGDEELERQVRNEQLIRSCEEGDEVACDLHESLIALEED